MFAAVESYQPPPGYFGNLTGEQEEKLEELIGRCLRAAEAVLQDGVSVTPKWRQHVLDKRMYLRFLRGRQWNVEEAFDMLQGTAKWRREFNDGKGVESITEEDCPNELKSGKAFFYKYDRQGRPITYVFPRLHFPDKTDPEEGVLALLFYHEVGEDALQLPVDTGTVVYDLKGMGYSNLDIHGFQPQVEIMQNHFPETLGVALVLNCPFIFWGAWQIIKRWLDPAVAEKVVICRSTKDVLQYIDEENLIASCGGKDPFEYRYVPPAERIGDDADYKPPWELPWMSGADKEKLQCIRQTALEASRLDPADPRYAVENPSLFSLEGDTVTEVCKRKKKRKKKEKKNADREARQDTKSDLE